MPGVNFFYSSAACKRRKKLLPRQGYYNMPFFILSAAKTMHMLTCHICQIFENLLSKILPSGAMSAKNWPLLVCKMVL